MPIETLNSEAFAIRDLTLGTDANGHYLNLICARATAYVLCFSRGAPIEKKDLLLTEPELQRLHNGGTLQQEGYRLQGVRKAVFDAVPSFRDFEAMPPEQIQVWSMFRSENSGKISLYLPEQVGPETCYVPLQYTCFLRPPEGDRPGALRVELKSSEGYTDGALLYQVEGCPAIPLPAQYLNRDIPLRIAPGDHVEVLVSAPFRSKYSAVP